MRAISPDGIEEIFKPATIHSHSPGVIGLFLLQVIGSNLGMRVLFDIALQTILFYCCYLCIVLI